MRGADSECKEQLWDPCSPPPLLHILQGDSGLSRPLLSQMLQVHELLWCLREKLPLWTKPHWAVRVSVPLEAGTRTQNPVLPPQRSAGSLPALKEGPSGQPPLESRAKSTGALHHCGQIGLSGQETTSLLGPVPSGAARIPWYHRVFCTLGNFVNSWRTMIFNP